MQALPDHDVGASCTNSNMPEHSCLHRHRLPDQQTSFCLTSSCVRCSYCLSCGMGCNTLDKLELPSGAQASSPCDPQVEEQVQVAAQGHAGRGTHRCQHVPAGLCRPIWCHWTEHTVRFFPLNMNKCNLTRHATTAPPSRTYQIKNHSDSTQGR